VERRDDSPNGHGESVSKSGGKVDGGKKGAMPKRVGNGKGDGYGKEEKRHQPYAEKELGIGRNASARSRRIAPQALHPHLERRIRSRTTL
jgi:hypothetical protein